MSARKRIFISYAREDGAELAQRLRTDLVSNGFKPWIDARQITGGDSWTDEIERGIDGADAVLALLSPGSYASRICRAEQLRALRKDKLVIPLLAKTAFDIPLHLEPCNFRDFTGVMPYDTQLHVLLEDLRESRDGANLKAEYRCTYVTAPPLPLNFVARPEEQHDLRQVVMANTDAIGVALTALEGMGGIGKTIMAQSLCHDEAIQQAFPDGVLWVTAGQEPVHNLRDRINEIRNALHDQPGPSESELASINRYRSLLRDKAVLLVIDDVWRVADIEPFLVESARSCVLFTTRIEKIAASLGARECRADLLSPRKSYELLARYSGLVLEQLPREAGLLIKQCGRLPLALAMVGAMLRGKPPAYWHRVLTLLQNADLSKIRAQFPNYPHADLLKCIQVSVNALELEQQERYLALAVLLEDMMAAPAVQQTLWNANSSDAMDTAEQFIGLSLAQREGAGIRLHDLQLDYVRAQFPDREALALIRGAVRLSSHIINTDPQQFASQMVGRLLSHQGISAIKGFTERIAKGAPKPWLRPMRAALYPPGTALIRTLAGHSGWVNSVAVAPGGERVLSASHDETLKIWDLETGRELQSLARRPQISNIIVALSETSSVRVFSCRHVGINCPKEIPGENEAKLLRLAAEHAERDHGIPAWNIPPSIIEMIKFSTSSAVYGVVVTADGKRAVSASWDNTLQVWDLESGAQLRTLSGHTGSVRAVALTPDDRWAVSASSDRTLKVWNLHVDGEPRTMAGHGAEVVGVIVCKDGRRAVSASWDRTLKVWDLEERKLVHTLIGHTGGVNAVALTPDGKQAVSGSDDRTLKVWDLESGKELWTLAGHAGAVFCVAVSPDGERVVSGSRDRTLKQWNLRTRKQLCTLLGHTFWVSGVALTPNGKQAVSASYDRTVKVWDLERRQEEPWTFASHTDLVRAVAVAWDGRRAVSASWDRTLKVWDLETGHELRTLEGHSEKVNGVAVSADGRRAVSASWDNTVMVWDLESSCEPRTLSGHFSGFRGVAVSADGRRVVSASADGTLIVWDLESGGEPLTLKGHRWWVDAVAESADGRRVVSASADGTLMVWDLERDGGRRNLEGRTLTGHSDAVFGVGMSGDGRLVVSASRDKTLKVWNLESGREPRTLEGHSAAVYGVAVSGDGRLAVSASADKTLMVWDLEAGAHVVTFTCDAAAVCCAISGDRRIVAGDETGRVHFLSLELENDR
jgi:WD40 repeat protein